MPNWQRIQTWCCHLSIRIVVAVYLRNQSSSDLQHDLMYSPIKTAKTNIRTCHFAETHGISLVDFNLFAEVN